MTLALRFAARSHPGLLRDQNEDSVYAGPRLLAVADGVGGHAAGEVASAVAIAAVAPLDEDAPGSDLLEALRARAFSANEHLRDMVRGDPSLEGMGTTLTAVLFAGSRLGLLHVGDSRCYMLRDGELAQITHDHTLVQSLVDEGRISSDDASSHPQRSLITRALDGRHDVDLDLSVREARAGDRYLLCTDGLTGPVASADTLREALSTPDPQAAVDQLVKLALRGGGPDNVTVLVADVVQADGAGRLAPVVAGAAAEAPQPPPAGAGDSPAGRAQVAEGRVTTTPAAPRSHVAPKAAGHRGRRVAIVVLAVLVLLGAGAGAGWAYVQSQYFVGVDGQNVAVFRGVAGSVAGLRLSSVEQRTDVSTSQLSDLDRARVTKGIVARDRADAVAIARRLEVQADTGCAPASPAPVAAAAAAAPVGCRVVTPALPMPAPGLPTKRP